MKTTSFFLILSVFLSCNQFILAQNATRFEAEMIIKKVNSADKKGVYFFFENDELKIAEKKGKEINKSFPPSNIKIAQYSYSEKPMIAEGIGITLTLGWMIGLPFFFTNKKKHWLVLVTDNEGLLFELKKNNYRQLLFEMNNKGIKVEDSGNRDYKPPKKKETNKAEEKKSNK